MRDSAPTDFPLPDGIMQPAGYVVLQQAVRLDRPVHGYGRWLQRIPEVYRNDVLDDAQGNLLDQTHCLATLRNYWSLMPMAEEARKPMFDLAPAYGALGSHAHLVRTCEGEFRAPAARLLEVCSIPSSS